MKAGDLRHRVDILDNQGEQNAYNEVEDDWQVAFTVWGAVEDLTGREYLDAAQTQAGVTTRIRVRYRTDVTFNPKKRAAWDGHTYDILSVTEVAGRRREVHLMCQEVI